MLRNNNATEAKGRKPILRLAGSLKLFVTFLLATLCLSRNNLFAWQAEDTSQELRLLVEFTSESSTDDRFEIEGDRALVSFNEDGASFQQPVGSRAAPVILRLHTNTTTFSVRVKFFIDQYPKSKSGEPTGLIVRPRFANSALGVPAVGLISDRKQRNYLGFARSFDPKGKKQFQLQPFQPTDGELILTRSESSLEVAYGSGSSFRPMGSVACPEDPIEAIEFMVLPVRKKTEQGVYRVQQIEFVGDAFYNQPPPVDWWKHVWLIKWVLGFAGLAWFLLYAKKHNLYLRKIF